MNTEQLKKAEELAVKFHETYERLAPQFGYETRIDTKEFDKNSPNGKLMIAVLEELLPHLISSDEIKREAVKDFEDIARLAECEDPRYLDGAVVRTWIAGLKASIEHPLTQSKEGGE